MVRIKAELEQMALMTLDATIAPDISPQLKLHQVESGTIEQK